MKIIHAFALIIAASIQILTAAEEIELAKHVKNPEQQYSA